MHLFFFVRVIVPNPGTIIFAKSLKNEAHPNFDGKLTKESPHPIISSKGFTLILTDSNIVFLFIPDKRKERNVQVIPIKIKVVLIGNSEFNKI